MKTYFNAGKGHGEEGRQHCGATGYWLTPDWRLDPAVPKAPPEHVYRDHMGIHAQKQPGHSYAGLAVLGGRLSPQQIRTAADLAERLGSGELRTTVMQNLLI